MNNILKNIVKKFDSQQSEVEVLSSDDSDRDLAAETAKEHSTDSSNARDHKAIPASITSPNISHINKFEVSDRKVRPNKEICMLSTPAKEIAVQTTPKRSFRVPSLDLANMGEGIVTMQAI